VKKGPGLLDTGPLVSFLASGARISRLEKRGLSGGQPRHVQPFSAPFCLPQVILKLLIEPTLRTGIECNGETHGHFRADARTAVKYTG